MFFQTFHHENTKLLLANTARSNEGCHHVGLVALKGEETAHEVGQGRAYIRFIRPTRAGWLRAIRGGSKWTYLAMALIREKREDGKKKRRGWAKANGQWAMVFFSMRGTCGSKPEHEIRASALSYLPPTYTSSPTVTLSLGFFSHLLICPSSVTCVLSVIYIRHGLESYWFWSVICWMLLEKKWFAWLNIFSILIGSPEGRVILQHFWPIVGLGLDLDWEGQIYSIFLINYFLLFFNYLTQKILSAEEYIAL